MPDGTALMSVSPEAVPVEAVAWRTRPPPTTRAPRPRRPAAADVDDPLLVTADEPHADRAATVSAAAAMPATRTVRPGTWGRPGLRSPAAGFRQVCTMITPQWVLGFLVDLGAWPSCAMDCSSYTCRAR